MANDSMENKSVVLSQGEYVFIQDTTKGIICGHCGPKNISLSNTEKTVKWDDPTQSPVACSVDQAIRKLITAPEGFYVELLNPHQAGTFLSPGQHDDATGKLKIGNKINIPGPSSFALYPGQRAKVIRGHRLSIDDYLVCVVYNAVQAEENKNNVLAKLKSSESEDSVENTVKSIFPDNLVEGQRIIIRGDQVSFFIPPTGIKVLQDKSTKEYVRKAVSLERMEFCILRNEDGEKRFEKGPKVVFPQPTEIFEMNTKNNSYIFKAIELNVDRGIYVKVTAPYEEIVNGEKIQRKEGDELFITGNDQRIYYPRPEHAIITYGGKHLIHYSTVIPEGDGQYVLDRITGNISTELGPKMLLLDPRSKVTVNRILSPSECELYYPGNHDALQYNLNLAGETSPEGVDDTLSSYSNAAPMAMMYTQDSMSTKSLYANDEYETFGVSRSASNALRGGSLESSRGIGTAGSVERKKSYTKPRTITIDRRFAGAVKVSVWPNYAIQILKADGTSRVVQGYKPVVLGYDEKLVSLNLSTSTPKTGNRKIKTAYLKVRDNSVSDLIEAETKDAVKVSVRLTYRIDFEGDPSKWFNTDDYVGILTDRMRSIVRTSIRNTNIETLNENYMQIVSKEILGEDGEGYIFDENGMRIHAVEIIEFKISNDDINRKLITSRHDTIGAAIEVKNLVTKLNYNKERDELQKQLDSLNEDIRLRALERERKILEDNHESEMKILINKINAKTKEKEQESAYQEILDIKNTKELARTKSLNDINIEYSKELLEIEKDKLKAHSDCVVAEHAAIQPHLIEAMVTATQNDLAKTVAESIGPMQFLNTDLPAVISRILTGGSAVATNIRNIIESQKTPVSK